MRINYMPIVRPSTFQIMPQASVDMMEEHERLELERLKREQRREARRRRILSNASSRMETLRGLPIPERYWRLKKKLSIPIKAHRSS